MVLLDESHPGLYLADVLMVRIDSNQLFLLQMGLRQTLVDQLSIVIDKLTWVLRFTHQRFAGLKQADGYFALSQFKRRQNRNVDSRLLELQ
jgi:hypothetical protein